ncbi:hypothetical protein Ancab_039335 [Ancistrocladus abbreviatus]
MSLLTTIDCSIKHLVVFLPTDIDECQDYSKNDCVLPAHCVNKIGVGHECKCPPGYLGSGTHSDPCSKKRKRVILLAVITERSLHLKFSESLVLPIYQVMPEMKLKISGVVKNEGGDGEEAGKGKERGRKGDDEMLGKTMNRGASKKGRIHEVWYMDSRGDELVGEELGSDFEGNLIKGDVRKNDDLGSAEIMWKKKKEGC